MLLGRTRRPAPCPACDAPLPADAVDTGSDGIGECPACGTPLMPVRAAGLLRRLPAFLVDLAVLAVTAGPLHLFLTWLVPSEPLVGEAKGLDATLTLATTPIGELLSRAGPFLILSLLYFLVFMLLGGRTLGQRLLRVRVVDRHGRPPGPIAAIARVAAGALALLPVGLGALWMVFDFERRGLHDHVSGTWVVREA